MKWVGLYTLILLCVLLVISCQPAMGAELVPSPAGVVTMDVGQEIPISFTLAGADAGISGFNIAYAVSDPSVLSITGFSFPDWVQLPKNSSAGQAEGYFMGVDLGQKMQPGVTSVPLFTIMVVGSKAGTATLTLTPKMVDDDLAGRYSPASLVVPIQVGPYGAGPNSPTAGVTNPSTVNKGTGAAGGAGPGTGTSDLVKPSVTVLTGQTLAGNVSPPQTTVAVLPESTRVSSVSLRQTMLTASTPNTTPAPTTPLSWVLPVVSVATLAVYVAVCRKNKIFGSRERK